MHSQLAISSAMNVDNEPRVDTNVGYTGDRPEPVPMDSDARSDASFDPLFDDMPEPVKQETNNDFKSPIQNNNSQPLGRPPMSAKPPPKGAPPLLASTDYSTYSPELLMTAFIDGQVILWDRRVSTSGKGVGRLWMSEKTPPWCLSVIYLPLPIVYFLSY